MLEEWDGGPLSHDSANEHQAIVKGQGRFTQHLLPWVVLRKGYRVRNLKFATYLKFATGENTNQINELW